MDDLSLNARQVGASPTKLVKLQVTQDTVCPWCYIGWKELEAAIIAAKRNGLPLKFDVEFKPYRLDATLPVMNPLDKGQLWLNKYGSERLSNAQVLLNRRGERFGINFFEGPIRRTGPCHRLLRYAYEHQRELQIGECVPYETCLKNDLQTKLVDALYDGFFVQNEDIADYHVLAKYSEQVGLMTYDETLAFLKSSAYKEEVEELIEQAQDRGISGVPYTVINSKWAIEGGQTAETYYNVFEKLALAA